MKKSTVFVGLDVHAATIAIAKSIPIFFNMPSPPASHQRYRINVWRARGIGQSPIGSAWIPHSKDPGGDFWLSG